MKRGGASAGRRLVVCQAFAPALLHFFGQLPHRLLGDGSPVAACEGGLCRVDAGQDFGASALALFPKTESFLNSVFRPRRRPLSTAWRTNASDRGVRCTSIRSQVRAHMVLHVSSTTALTPSSARTSRLGIPGVLGIVTYGCRQAQAARLQADESPQVSHVLRGFVGNANYGLLKDRSAAGMRPSGCISCTSMTASSVIRPTRSSHTRRSRSTSSCPLGLRRRSMVIGRQQGARATQDHGIETSWNHDFLVRNLRSQWPRMS